MAAKVEFYFKPTCPYCIKARKLLEGKGVTLIEYNVADHPELRPEMEARSKRTTVPQIFIDGKHIGGCDELHAQDAEGKIDILLK